MFYLKYRPKNLSELDNQVVKEIIEKILSGSHLPHAFLFYGQKGTGKTSTARIFAKAINCLNNAFNKKNDSIEPCNQCSNCISIAQGNNPDVVEIDAASNRGIDEVKNLIQESNFLPMTGHYRVFIIDEVHMMTQEAFNALLKTLEEPPPSVIFILATTNKDKVPKTIISRCHLVNFGQAKKNDIINMLKRIVVKENISVNQKLISLIADYSDYSFRDAAKILEELLIQNKLNYEEAKKFLGLTKKNFLLILASKKRTEVFNWIDEFAKTNGDFKTLIESCLFELRQMLLSKQGIDFEEKIELLFSEKEIVILIKLLTEAYQNLRLTPIESLPLEIAVYEFYNYLGNKN